MTYTIKKNEQYNSIEITFDGKPTEAIREALKALRFRWHGVRRVWYGYTDEETARNAIRAAESAKQTEEPVAEHTKQIKVKKAALRSLWDRCDTSDLPSYGTDNEIKKAVREEARKAGGSYDKYVASYIRKHLRERFPECKFSVTSGGAGYLNAVNIEIKSSPFSRELVKGDLASDFEHLRWDHWENAPELDAILKYCVALFNVFDSDDGDIYADYGAHHDLYGSAKISYDYSQTEITDEQKHAAQDFAIRKAEAEAAEQARREAEYAEFEKQMEHQRNEAERLEKIRTAQATEIVDHVVVEDLAESEQIAVVGLPESCGKENTIEEVRKSLNDRRAERRETRTDAIITRKIHFDDNRIFETFCHMFLHDFPFLTGKGGTATEDVRINIDNINKLNQLQNEKVKFYCCDCIGVYFKGRFQFVIDPQGYGYARYVLIPDDMTDSYKADEKRKEWREFSEHLPSLYFPEPIAEQILFRAGLREGEPITLLHLDPWICAATTTAAMLNSATITDYAQYKGAARICFTPIGIRHAEEVYIKPGQECAIWRGILPDVPDSIKYTTVREDNGTVMQTVNYAGEGARDYMIRVIEYYISIGFEPVVDTIQR